MKTFGRESELLIKAASLIDYDGDTLTIYEAGTRELTEEETRILNKANAARADYEKKYPYSESYFIAPNYIKRNFPDFEYLAGYETKCGRRYNRHNNTIIDNAIKGAAIIKYKIYHQ